MAVVGDRTSSLQAQIDSLNATASSAAESARADAHGRIAQLQADLYDEKQKRARWDFESKAFPLPLPSRADFAQTYYADTTAPD